MGEMARQMLGKIPVSVESRLESLCLPHIDRGILPSEMAAVCGVAELLGVGRIIESGRYLGYSTETLSRYFAGADVSIDSVEYSRADVALECERRLASCGNVRLYYGDAFKLLPGMLASDSRSTLVLLDGPKGRPAVGLALQVMRRYPHVAAVFLHDSYIGTEARTAELQTSLDYAFTDDREFVKRFAHLDKGILFETLHQDRYSGDPTMANGKSYGPTLALMLSPGGGSIEDDGPHFDYLRTRFLFYWGLGEAKIRSILYSARRIARKCKSVVFSTAKKPDGMS